jgi:hypothetical protein
MLYGAMLVTVACVVLLNLALATAVGRMQRMTGTIKAVDPVAQTAVIEVPLGHDTFTVAGPLSPQATVKKGGQTAQLQDLQVGERVTVTWEQTAKGHEIERLEAR